MLCVCNRGRLRVVRKSIGCLQIGQLDCRKLFRDGVTHDVNFGSELSHIEDARGFYRESLKVENDWVDIGLYSMDEREGHV